MTKVMMISDHASPLERPGSVDSGGQNVFVGSIAEELGRAGILVDIFTRRDRANLPEVIEWKPNVRVINVPAGPPQFVRKEELLPYIPDFTRTCRHYCLKEGYDISHANFFMSGLVAADLKAQLKLPFVVTFHALGRVRRLHQASADGFPDARCAIEERIVKEADRILAECPQDSRDLLDLYKAKKSSLCMVPCGVDTRLFKPEMKWLARRRIGFESHGGRLILSLGRMVPRKGVDNIILSVPLLDCRHRKSVTLLIVGGSDSDGHTDPEIARLRQLTSSAGVTDQVIFTGSRPREDLRFFYSASDLFVSTPWYEPFGITPLEAMACAVPVIGSRVGGIKYTIQEGRTGLLVAPRDPSKLAGAIDLLLDDAALREELGRNGLQRVHQRFTWSQVADEILKIYMEVITRRTLTSAVSQPSETVNQVGL